MRLTIPATRGGAKRKSQTEREREREIMCVWWRKYVCEMEREETGAGGCMLVACGERLIDDEVRALLTYARYQELPATAANTKNMDREQSEINEMSFEEAVNRVDEIPWHLIALHMVHTTSPVLHASLSL